MIFVALIGCFFKYDSSGIYDMWLWSYSPLWYSGTKRCQVAITCLSPAVTELEYMAEHIWHHILRPTLPYLSGESPSVLILPVISDARLPTVLLYNIGCQNYSCFVS